MTQEEAYQRLNVEIDLIPAGLSNRPGTRIRPTHITIHNTANAVAGADARMHARYVKGPGARDRQVSWHFTVDDHRCIKHLPTTEKSWHAGAGNSKSVAIEICEHRGINQNAANERAALLAAVLIFALNIPVERVVQHQFWTGKPCPHLLLSEARFGGFRNRVAQFLSDLESEPAHGVGPEDEPGAAPENGGGPLSLLVDQYGMEEPSMGVGPEDAGEAIPEEEEEDLREAE